MALSEAASSTSATRSGVFAGAPSGHRPAQLAADPVALRQIFGDQAAGEATGAIDDNVELTRLRHEASPWDGSMWPHSSTGD